MDPMDTTFNDNTFLTLKKNNVYLKSTLKYECCICLETDYSYKSFSCSCAICVCEKCDKALIKCPICRSSKFFILNNFMIRILIKNIITRKYFSKNYMLDRFRKYFSLYFLFTSSYDDDNIDNNSFIYNNVKINNFCASPNKICMVINKYYNKYDFSEIELKIIFSFCVYPYNRKEIKNKLLNKKIKLKELPFNTTKNFAKFLKKQNKRKLI